MSGCGLVVVASARIAEVRQRAGDDEHHTADNRLVPSFLSVFQAGRGNPMIILLQPKWPGAVVHHVKLSRSIQTVAVGPQRRMIRIRREIGVHPNRFPERC
jgi:hypothetical protein